MGGKNKFSSVRAVNRQIKHSTVCLSPSAGEKCVLHSMSHIQRNKNETDLSLNGTLLSCHVGVPTFKNLKKISIVVVFVFLYFYLH